MRGVSALGMLLFCAACNTAGPTPLPEAQAPTIRAAPRALLALDEMRELTQGEKTVMTETLASTLKDPRFRWTKIPKKTDEKGLTHYCATVNAKNSHGGYTGFQPFIAVASVTKGRVVSARIATDGNEKSQTIVEMCAEKGLNPFEAI